MIVGSDKELAELNAAVQTKKAQEATAFGALQANDKAALNATQAISTSGPSEQSCKVLNSSLLSRSQNDETLRQVNRALRTLGEYTPQTEARLASALDEMKVGIASITEPSVKACETAFPAAKLPSPGGR